MHRRLILCLGLALLAAGCAADSSAPREAADAPTAPLPPAARRDLGALFVALAAIDAHRTNAADAPGPNVSIVQIGDSHSAGDFFSARMRELFQSRFGAGGRGLLPPGLADRYYDPKLVSVTQSSGWQRESARSGSGPFGVAGVIQRSNQGGDTMTLSADETAGFDRASVTFRRLPNGGSFALSADGGTPRVVSTAGASGEPVRMDFRTSPGRHTLTLTSQGDGPLELLGWGVWRQGSGVRYQNFGVIGAQIDVLGRTDPGAVAAELRDASLVVVAFGTNEAFGRESDLGDYESRFTTYVRQIAAEAPRASILIVGPPDVNRRGASGTPCRDGAPADDSSESDPPPTPGLPVILAAMHAGHAAPHGGGSGGGHAPGGGHALGGGHASGGGYASGGGHAGHAGARGPARGGRSGSVREAGRHRGRAAPARTYYGAAWARPEQLDIVAAAQRAAAQANGWYFWDWSEAMGGACAMTGWVAQHLGRADHVHMTRDGYDQSAELLFRAIMSSYDAWRGERNRTAAATP
jgi:lysophospholipase L1-like esterase